MVKKYKNIIIINTIDEYDYLLKEFSGRENLFLIKSYELYNRIDNDKTKYFYLESKRDDNLFLQCYKLSQIWFINQVDNFSNNHEALGLIYSARIQSALSHLTRVFLSIIKWIETTEKFIISKK